MSWLKKGDTVGLIAPSSALGEFDLKPILDILKIPTNDAKTFKLKDTTN